MQNIAGGIPLIERPDRRTRQFVLACGIAAAAFLVLTLGVTAVRTPVATAQPAGVHLSILTTAWTSTGADQGTRRLHLEAVLQNNGQSAAPAPGADSFAVRTGDGRTFPLTEAVAYGTPAAANLRPGERRSVDLYADLPAGLAGLTLTMSSGEQEESIPVP